MQGLRRWVFGATALSVLTLLVAGPGTVNAEESNSGGESPTVTVGEPAGIVLQPEAFRLRGRRSQQQLLVTGKYANDEVRDLTTAAEYVSSNPKVVKVEETVARPVGNGTATITARVGGYKASLEATVSGMEQPMPVSFQNETLAALSKAGCNAGACHGSPSGKNGFRLSLRAYDPALDIMTLRQEYFGRRTNPMEPDESLILKKPLMQVAHGGGRRMMKGDAVHRILRQWIAEGLQSDLDAAPELQKIEILPKARVLNEPASRQQMVVQGTFSDGTVRDLTPLTVFSSSDESVASVDEAGVVHREGRGESAILARYLDKKTTAHVTFLEDVEGFAWTDPPTNNFVDKLVFEKLRKLQILPSQVCSDEVFLRRAYLDLTGRLPQVEETRAFLNDDSSDKRAKLIDRLLASADFAEFWSLKWADILRANSDKLNETGVYKFQRWLFDSVYEDKPVDELAYELLTASGSVYENPAANYWRASRDPQDATETTAQLFLGIRMQCAKCHNHPFERWTQDNYYGVAAAFARLGRKKGPRDGEEVIYSKASGEIKQPRTGEVMDVHLLLKGDVDKIPASKTRREVFAEWLTAPDNPFFARAAVNRIWGNLMGRGLVDPVDDFRASNPPSNAKLLDELARRFAENGFSRKWAIRTIMTSRAYQLSSQKNEFNEDDDVYTSHARTRLLTAEQLLDAICQVTGVQENFKGVPSGTRTVALPEPPADHYFLKIFGQPQREMACECERSDESNLSQALQMINGPVVHNKLRNDKGRIARLIEEGKSDEEIITELYLAALCRTPEKAEMQAAKQHIANSSDRRGGLEDVGWAVLNSKEFLFQH